MIYIRESSSPEYWDNYWNISKDIGKHLNGITKTKATKKIMEYLSPNSGIILEGGCGSGVHVAALSNNGYKCVGVDYARKTISLLNKRAPNYDFRYDDVRKLSFERNEFVGYFSSGLIEHFWDGYQEILNEMDRVIKPGGYLFLTFPYMSFLRRIKKRLGIYPLWGGKDKPKDFYQFALDQRRVISKFKENGFNLIEKYPISGFKGFGEEFPSLSSCALFDTLYKNYDSSIVIKIPRKIIGIVLSKIGGHSIFLVFRKQ